ncbi:PIG-L family deacetylase [Candidatus Uhrbacteria bacterium]|nr:PIG-L family deacetylase [Candidatus Uhrbacteria bacterium]
MASKQPKNILVVAAHPDDETLGCGATVAKHVASGDNVTVLIMAQGVLARKEVKDRRDLLEHLWEDAKTANAVLGVQRLILKDLPDNKMNAIPLLDIVHTIEEVVLEIRPSIVYTHHHGDVNMDHQTISKAMQAICRPMADTSIDQVYAFEIPSATNWNFRHEAPFCPTVFIEVDDTIEKKILAMERYTGEIRPFPHPRSRQYLQSLAHVRGGQVGFKCAEAFELVFSRMKNCP